MYNEKPIIKLFKYENRFIQIAQIDDYESVSWERKLYEAGQFTITINFNIPNAHLFKRGMFVQFGNDPSAFGEIRKIQDTIGADGKGNQKRVITGYDARYIFKRRIISNLNNGDCWQGTGKAEIVMENLIADQCGNNAEEKRKLPVFLGEENLNFMSCGGYVISKSADGITWNTTRLIDDINQYGTFLNILYCKEQKKLIALSGGDSEENIYCWISYDFGETWETHKIQYTPIANYGVYRIFNFIYVKERGEYYFLVSLGGLSGSNNQKCVAFKSSDGVNWTYSDLDLFEFGSGDLLNFIYIPDYDTFYAVGYEFTNISNGWKKGVVFKSSDFFNWTSVYSVTDSSNWVQLNGICYSPVAKKFIAVGNKNFFADSFNFYAISENATQFDVHEGIIPSDVRLTDASYITETNKIIITGLNNIYTSDDGINWQTYFTNIPQFSKVVYNKILNLYLTIYSQNAIGLSKDLNTWEINSSNVVGRGYISLELKELKGKEVSVSESYTNLYEVLKTIATNGDIGWRVNFKEGELFFEVYEGTDRSKGVFFDVNMDSLTNGSFDDSSDNFANVVYIGGKGEGSERDIYEGESLINGSSPSAFDRFESWSNESEMTKEEEYQAKADGILKEAVKTLSFSGAGLAKSPYQYRKQYDVGDRITVAFSDIKATVQILSVTEHWQKGVYNMTFSFGKTEAELKNQLHTMLRQIQKASNKSSVIDSVKWYNLPNTVGQSIYEVVFNTLGFSGNVSSPYNLFKLVFTKDKVGAKSYNIYVKNLTGSSLILTTGIIGASTVTLPTGTYVTRIYVDESGNVIKYNFS